jgi:hypothetical protein
MFAAAASVTIDRPIDQVFAYLVALDPHLPEWASGVLSMRRTTPEPLGVGARLEGTSQMLGRPVRWQYTVTTFGPPTTFGGSVHSAAFDFTELYTLEALGSSTRINQHAEVQLHGLFRLLEPLLAMAIRRLLASDLGRLKGRLETA